MACSAFERCDDTGKRLVSVCRSQGLKHDFDAAVTAHAETPEFIVIREIVAHDLRFSRLQNGLCPNCQVTLEAAARQHAAKYAVIVDQHVGARFAVGRALGLVYDGEHQRATSSTMLVKKK